MATISLINVSVKIESKAVALRVSTKSKAVLWIHHNQHAFGRSITDVIGATEDVLEYTGRYGIFGKA